MVAAGRSIGIEAADTAVIAKMVRVMMLAPFLILLSAAGTRQGAPPAAQRRDQDHHSLVRRRLRTGRRAQLAGRLPPALVSHVNDLDTFLLAMAGLGLGTHLSAIRRAGLKPLLLAPCYSPGWCSAVDYSPAWRSPGVLRQEALHGLPQGLVQGFHLIDAVAAQAAMDQPASRIEPCLATRARSAAP